ncbi:hypothetical protein MtrunA17_Chr3g0145161 [Medicago truncatula]|uniref:Transmembrane protein n=1 Tax=Medicago truncatula TaxID=3880 RepID=A0A396J3C2_MEDTR|nr:hypothetical protein MtrunA17_Chr3g0145161 [Medicago truncatula]
MSPLSNFGFYFSRISAHSSSTSLEKLSSSMVILRTKFSSTALICVVFFYLYFVSLRSLQYFCRKVITVILVRTFNLLNYFGFSQQGSTVDSKCN